MYVSLLEVRYALLASVMETLQARVQMPLQNSLQLLRFCDLLTLMT